VVKAVEPCSSTCSPARAGLRPTGSRIAGHPPTSFPRRTQLSSRAPASVPAHAVDPVPQEPARPIRRPGSHAGRRAGHHMGGPIHPTAIIAPPTRGIPFVVPVDGRDPSTQAPWCSRTARSPSPHPDHAAAQSVLAGSAATPTCRSWSRTRLPPPTVTPFTTWRNVPQDGAAAARRRETAAPRGIAPVFRTELCFLRATPNPLRRAGRHLQAKWLDAIAGHKGYQDPRRRFRTALNSVRASPTPSHTPQAPGRSLTPGRPGGQPSARGGVGIRIAAPHSRATGHTLGHRCRAHSATPGPAPW